MASFSRRSFLNPFRLLAAGMELREGLPLPGPGPGFKARQAARLEKAAKSRADEATVPRFLRPPGALSELDFQARCDGCGDCLPACPHKAIQLLAPGLGGERSSAAILARSEACQLCEGLPCITACDAGALSLDRAQPVRMGLARLIPERCLRMSGQPCDYCVSSCPTEVNALHFDGRRPRVDAERCTGCGQCEWICPSQEPALVVEALTEAQALVPAPGQVVGLDGPGVAERGSAVSGQARSPAQAVAQAELETPA